MAPGHPDPRQGSLLWSKGKRHLGILMVHLQRGRYVPAMHEPMPEGPSPNDALTRALSECRDKLPALIRAQYDSLLARAQRIHGGNENEISPARMVHEAHVRLVDQSKVAARSLARLNPRMARIVDMRGFGGLTVAECAAELGLSPRTIDTEWAFARSWLQRE